MNRYSTHIPILEIAVKITTGPVIELGQGKYSTLLLDKLCGENRLFVTCETNKNWFNKLSSINRISLLLNQWDDLYKNISGINFSLAFIDHAPANRRIIDINNLFSCCDMFVVHDTESKEYNYEEILSKFNFRYNFTKLTPYTSVVSNNKYIFIKLLENIDIIK